MTQNRSDVYGVVKHFSGEKIDIYFIETVMGIVSFSAEYKSKIEASLYLNNYELKPETEKQKYRQYFDILMDAIEDSCDEKNS